MLPSRSMKNQSPLTFIPNHINLLQNWREKFILMAGGLEKLDAEDVKRLIGGGKSTLDSSSEKPFQTLCQSAMRDLAFISLKRINASNAAFFQNLGRLLSPRETVKSDRTNSLTKVSSNRIQKSSIAYRNLIKQIGLEPRHIQALASLEFLEKFLLGSRLSESLRPPTIILYKLTRDENGQSKTKVSIDTLNPKTPTDFQIDLPTLKNIFDTSIVCCSHVAGKIKQLKGRNSEI
jgi:hypothetical protein